LSISVMVITPYVEFCASNRSTCCPLLPPPWPRYSMDRASRALIDCWRTKIVYFMPAGWVACVRELAVDEPRHPPVRSKRLPTRTLPSTFATRCVAGKRPFDRSCLFGYARKSSLWIDLSRHYSDRCTLHHDMVTH